MGNPGSRLSRCPKARSGGMCKNGWLRNLDVKPAADLASNIIAVSGHALIWPLPAHLHPQLAATHDAATSPATMTQLITERLRTTLRDCVISSFWSDTIQHQADCCDVQQ